MRNNKHKPGRFPLSPEAKRLKVGVYKLARFLLAEETGALRVSRRGVLYIAAMGRDEGYGSSPEEALSALGGVFVRALREEERRHGGEAREYQERADLARSRAAAHGEAICSFEQITPVSREWAALEATFPDCP